ncbi:MAG: AMP-binding protein [Hydrogenophaga sp.]|uniref:AMP-binding protein n=1 Tax=Hydrogenophaga sp. TaxID=1904254 RepID=UPI002AB886E5|nr:AMP-binding protein [Hydrogenophaga sp.]MDZ4187355.1 AMP-binding protein [Hydrogenophaga sp.]
MKNSLSNFVKINKQSDKARLVFPDAGVDVSYESLDALINEYCGGVFGITGGRSEIILISCRNNIDSIAVVLACQRVGSQPSVIPPVDIKNKDWIARFESIISLGTRGTIVVDDSVFNEEVLDCLSKYDVSVVSYSDLKRLDAIYIEKDSDVAFLQFTSGSVGSPKGIIVTHENVFADVKGMAAAHSWREDEVFVGWTPLYHDMGLIGIMASAIILNCTMVLIDPLSFIRRPSKWLRLISDYSGTVSAAPNFAYALMSKLPDSQLVGLNLKSWRYAYNGSEPIRKEDNDSFIEKFEKYGFNKGSLYNVYGMAEVSVIATFQDLDTSCKYLSIAYDSAVSVGERVRLAQPGERQVTIAGVGKPIPSVEVKLMDVSKDVFIKDECVGEIAVSGDALMRGYIGRDLELHCGHFRTGDLGFIWSGDLYVFGRIKDRFKKNGKSFHASDIEYLVSGLDGVKMGSIVSFVYYKNSREYICLAVTARKPREEYENLAKSIKLHVYNEMQLNIDAVWIVGSGEIPKTSSGKLQRNKAKEYAENGLWGLPVISSID